MSPRQASRTQDCVKDQAQYGFGDIGGQKLATARRQARALVAFAEGVLAR